MRPSSSLVDCPITHYGKLLFDCSTPGDAYSPGMNVDKAWADVLRDNPAIRDFQRGVVTADAPILVSHIKRFHYTAQDRCRLCHSAQAAIKHQCRRCYNRTYMRNYYQTHPHRH